MKHIIPILLGLTGVAQAFCGFYVAKADTKLFNQASKVVVVRDLDRTVLTMANDYQGDLKEFAIVFPVPVVLQEGQIHVTDTKYIEHLDAYTAPRLVEYHDPNPCEVYRRERMMLKSARASSEPVDSKEERAKSLGVTIEAEYQVGEYDILILSAEQSDGLQTWLNAEGYRTPEGAEEVLGSYIKQKMKFFVAKVNLEKQNEAGYSYLRPIQVAYESQKFSLPIRLGTVNAKGDQEIIAFMITRAGRVECSNYKTVRLPSNLDVPMFVRDDFGTFYKDMFYYQAAKHENKAVMLEYAWNMNWCDPCAADPLSPDELLELGCYWIDASDNAKPGQPQPQPRPGVRPLPRRPAPAQARQAFVTRLHAVYNAETFPEDLMFQNTGDSSNFQGRYILRHAWKGKPEACDQARKYFRDLGPRMQSRVDNLVSLTGWDREEIEGKMTFPAPPPKDDSWWQKLWK